MARRPDYVTHGDIFSGFPSPLSRSLIGLASRNKDDSEWLEILLKHGANPNLVQPKIGGDDTVDYSAGMTPVFQAIDSGSMKNIDLLINAGADVNHQDNFGNTPMMHAVRRRRFDVVLRLLEAGADCRIRNNDGKDLAYRTVLFDKPVDDRVGFRTQEGHRAAEGKGIDVALVCKKVAEDQRRLNDQ